MLKNLINDLLDNSEKKIDILIIKHKINIKSEKVYLDNDYFVKKFEWKYLFKKQ